MSVRAVKTFFVAVLLVLAGTAQATITVYTSQASFLAAISAPGIDTYDDLPLASVPSPITRTAGPYGYTGTVTTTTFFMAGTVADVWLSTNTATDTITLNGLPANVRGIGGFFFGSDVNGASAAGDIMVAATDGSGTVTQTVVGALQTSFLGFVSNGPLTSLTLTTVQPMATFLWPTANNLVMGLAGGPGPATHFSVSAPPTATAGSAFNFTVTALDASNATATGYAGTVHLTSTDAGAVLPANSTLVNGVGTFSATLNTLGNQTISATDTVTSGITGTSSAILVAAVAPPVLQSAKSRKVHGIAGTFDLGLLIATPVNHNPTTETRAGPAHSIVFAFDKPVVAGSASIGEGTAIAGAPTFSGNEMTVPLTGVTNPQYVTVNVSGVAGLDGSTGGAGSVRIGFLFGDANQSRQVTVADVGIVNAALLQPLTNVNFLYDVNVDGKLTVADKGLVNANLLIKLPTP